MCTVNGMLSIRLACWLVRGVVVMLGVAFVPTLIIVFMIAAAIYDAWAVYKSKHMLDLADTMINLRLPILLVAPQEKGYSFVEETSSMKDRDAPAPTPSKGAPKKQKGKDAMFMGLGDRDFPRHVGSIGRPMVGLKWSVCRGHLDTDWRFSWLLRIDDLCRTRKGSSRIAFAERRFHLRLRDWRLHLHWISHL